jgi:hypothetical protein
MQAAGAITTSWIQVLLELQRDWTRHETYDGARSIVEEHAGRYGIGLAYAREMIRSSRSRTVQDRPRLVQIDIGTLGGDHAQIESRQLE